MGRRRDGNLTCGREVDDNNHNENFNGESETMKQLTQIVMNQTN